MNTRTLMTTLAAVTLILGSSTAAFAWHGGHNGGYNGGGNYNCPNGYSGGANCYYGNNGNTGNTALTPEKQQAIVNIVNESDTRIQPLMQQYQAKRMELDALAGNPNVKQDAISKLATEIAALQGQIRTEMDARNAKINAEGGVANGMMGIGRGMGRGMGRHGGGHGGMGNHWN